MVFIFYFSATYAAIIFTGNRQSSEGNVNAYLFFVIYRPNVQKCATSRVKSEISAAKTFGSLHVLGGGPVGFFGGQWIF